MSFDTPASGSDDTLAAPNPPPSAAPAPDLLGEPSGRIGPYKLLQTIGEGGFGVVFMAEQEQPMRRRVALKVVKAGMDTKQVLARFEAERQALAMMDHPNIARVFDAGSTPAGRPYFVMELVRGVPITDYCDTQQLSTRARIELFIFVCQAIQHAHQKGVIHRDIKPSNVLVTMHDSRPVPKVIDFGIAKATGQRLTDQTLFTEYHQLIGTPEYMSPEQAEMSGLDIDTRTDVYSLGVLLYQLLTGSLPIDRRSLMRGLDELRKHIRESEPPRPSTRVGASANSVAIATRHGRVDLHTLQRTLRGDLDWVTMRAMEKDRTRRYETANALAMELQRYLNNEPVLAGPPSTLYRIRKFARRNRVWFAAGSVISLALVAGLVMAVTGLLQASRQLAVAEHAKREESRQRAIAEQALAAANTARRAAEQARDEAEFRGYTAAINSAWSELQRGDGVAARRQLETTAERLRGWEYRMLWNSADRSLATRFTLPRAASGYVAALSPDGAMAATRAMGAGRFPIHIHDARSGKLLIELETQEHDTTSMEFSPDHRWLAWNYRGHPHVRVFDLRTKDAAIPSALEERSVRSLGFTPDSRGILIAVPIPAAGLDAGVHLFEIEGWKHVRHLAGDWRLVPTSGAVSPDGRWAAIGGAPSDPLRIISLKDGQIEFEAPAAEGIHSVAFSADSASLAACDERGRILRARRGDSGWQPDTEFSLPASGGSELRYLHHATGDLLCLGGANGLLMTLTPDGRPQSQGCSASSPIAALAHDARADELISIARDGTACAWDAARIERVPQGATLSLGFAGTSDRLVCGMISLHSAGLTSVLAYDLAALPRPAVLKTYPMSLSHSFAAQAVCAEPGGSRLLVAGGSGWQQGMLKIFDLETGLGLFRSDIFYPDDLRCGVWRPDGRGFATGGTAGSLYEFSAGDYSPRRVRHVFRGRLNHLVYAPDSATIFAAGSDGAVRRLACEAIEPGRLLIEPSDDSAERLAVSPDGAALAVGFASGALKVLAVSDGRPILERRERGRAITALSFLPDGTRLACGSKDGAIQLWDAATWRGILTIQFDKPVVDLCFSPQGDRLVYALNREQFAQFDALPESHRRDERRGAAQRARFGDSFERTAAAFDPVAVASHAKTPLDRYRRAIRFVDHLDGSNWGNFLAVAAQFDHATDLDPATREACAEFVRASSYFGESSVGTWVNEDIAWLAAASDQPLLDYALGLAAIEAVVEAARDLPEAINTQAFLLYRCGLFDEALAAADKAAESYRAKRLARSDNDVVKVLVFAATGHLAEARALLAGIEEPATTSQPQWPADLEPLLDEARRAVADSSGVTHPPRHSRAEIEKRWEDFLKQFPNDIQAIETLVHLFRRQQRTAEAERLVDEAEARVMAGLSQRREQEYETNRLLQFLLREKRLDAAEPIARMIVDRSRRRYGDAHAATVNAYRNLSELLLTWPGRAADAEAIAREQVQRSIELYGPTHAAVARQMVLLGWTRAAQNQFDEAESSFREARAMIQVAGTDADRDWMLRNFRALRNKRTEYARTAASRPASQSSQPVP